MKISKRGIDFIKKREGYSLRSYQDSKGIYTIGYGHTKNVTSVMVITKKQAEEFLEKDLAEFEDCINGNVLVPLSQLQFDALVSLCFNIGEKAFINSTLLELLNQGEYDTVPAQLMRWIYCNKKPLDGLKKRRQAEARMWEQGSALDVFLEAMPQGKSLTQSTTALGATTSGIATVASSAREIAEIAQSGNLQISWAMVVLVLGIFGLGGSIWVIRERARHAREYGI